MKFEQLSKEHQEFLMYCLFDHIKRKVMKEERDQIIEPTYEEYEAFFDEEYEIVDELPELNTCNRFEIIFKAVLQIEK